MKRHVLLLLVTASFVLFVMIGIRLNWGRGTILPKPKSSKPDPIFWQKFWTLNSIGKGRPFTESEMALLRHTIVDPDKYVRVEAADALRRATYDPNQRKEAIRLLIGRLKDPEWIVRVYAISSLEHLKAREALPHLRPLLNDPRPEVRERVLKALGNLGAKETIPSIIPLLKDPSPEVRQQAKKTLQQLGYKVGE
jgi:HEAT repeat protein